MVSMRVKNLLFLSLCLANTSFAQTFFASPNALLQQEVAFNQANECYIHFVNPGGSSLQLHWRLIESNIPAAWDIDLCDYGTCYSGIPGNGLMNVVQDTIQAYLKLIVQPSNAPGAAWVAFKVYEEGNAGNFLNVYFSLHTPGTLGTAAPVATSMLVYPNPANAVLYLENQGQNATNARLLDANGRLAWQGSILANSKIMVPVLDLPAGLYMLQNGNQRQKIIISR